MDHALAELQRRYQSDPSDRGAFNQLIRALIAAQRDLEAYALLFDDGALDRREERAMKLGAKLAERERGLFDKKLGKSSRFAVRKTGGSPRAWRYLDLASIKEEKRPVLSVTHDGREGTQKTLLQTLPAFQNLRTLFLDHSRNFKTELLLSLGPLPSLRHLVLKSFNVSDSNDINRRRGFQHLCSMAPLQSLQLHSSKIAYGNYEHCALSPALRALDLSFCKDIKSLQFLAKLPQLEALSLSYNRRIHKDLFPETLSALRFLDLSYLSDHGETLEKLNLPRLETLSLASGRLTGRHIREIATFKTLQTLELQYNPKLKVKDLEPLRELTGLERLSLRFCSGLDETVFELLEEIPSLQLLDIRASIDARQARRIADQKEIELLTDKTNSFLDYWRWKPRIVAQCSGRP